MKLINHLKIFFVCIPALIGCADHLNHSQKISHSIYHGAPVKSIMAGLAFVGVDHHYQSSSLYWYDFRNGTITRTMTGQSGDPLLTVGDQEQSVFFFNRSLGYESITRGEWSNQQFTAGQQRKLTGNPYFALPLSNGHIAIGLYGTGELWQVELNPWRVVTKISTTDLGLDLFRPADAFTHGQGDQQKLYVLHHGFTENYEANASQRILAFKLIDEQLALVGQSTPLTSTSGRFFHQDQEGIDIAGLCTPFLKQKGCRAGIDRFNFDDFTVLSLAHLDDWDYESGGSITAGCQPSELVVDLLTTSGTARRRFAGIVDYSAEQVSVREVLLLNEEMGTYLIKADPSSHSLFIGDTDNKGNPRLHILGPEKAHHIVALPEIPYQGLLIPPYPDY